MNAAEREALLRSTLKSLRTRYPGVGDGLTDGAPSASEQSASAALPAHSHTLIDPAEPLLCEFVFAMMLWESTTQAAVEACTRLARSVVDFNELRICMPDEVVALIGASYPHARERAERLRASLATVYSREHAVTLEHLHTAAKREAKEYLDTLDGAPRFATARVTLLRLAMHSAPVDSRIARRLTEAHIISDGTSVDDAASMLERKTKAGELLECYCLLQAWADDADARDTGSTEAAAEGATASGRRSSSRQRAADGPKRPPHRSGGTRKSE
jgi:hypothetical protein